MPIVLGTDLGTTTITAAALDTASGEMLAVVTCPNQSESTNPADKIQGRSEWDARSMVAQACACLRGVAERLGERRHELAGIGITGQQHGVVIVDDRLTPRTPFINWQDRRGEQNLPGSDQTYVRRAAERAGPDAPRRAGCRLAAGYLAVTLFWMKERNILPPSGTACFLMDYFGATLTGTPPVTDATCAASSGVLNVSARDWDRDVLAALGLARSLFPAVRPSGAYLGTLTSIMAEATGLPEGLPIFGGIGDNQASFVGGVADKRESVLVNVGTGGQVAAYSASYVYDGLLETRPYPGEGYLLVSAGLSGGGAYAVLERFYRALGAQLFGIQPGQPLYPLMNQLAARIPPGADGLRCEPFFSGTRAQPELRAAWSGISTENFTPGHMTRALLEGMARAFLGGYERMTRHANLRGNRLIGAGNGLRENPVLARIVSDAFALPLLFPLHREEAAFGAALMAAVGAEVYQDLETAGRLIRYAPSQTS